MIGLEGPVEFETIFLSKCARIRMC